MGGSFTMFIRYLKKCLKRYIPYKDAYQTTHWLWNYNQFQIIWTFEMKKKCIRGSSWYYFVLSHNLKMFLEWFYGIFFIKFMTRFALLTIKLNWKSKVYLCIFTISLVLLKKCHDSLSLSVPLLSIISAVIAFLDHFCSFFLPAREDIS